MNNNYYAKLAKNKSLLKEYKTSESDRSVYLNDKDEFQIQLFNPETKEICARIFIEDTQLSHDIVIRPGERLWLERYTDKAKKFKFETYIVDGRDGSVRDAISHNGNIKIEFFRRKQDYNSPYSISTISVNGGYGYEPYRPIDITWNNSVTGARPIENVYYTSLTADAGNTINTATNASCTITTTGIDLTCDAIKPASCAISDGVYYYNTIKTTEPENRTAVYNSDFYKDKANLETGRVSEGGYSRQKFDTVNMEFESWPFRTETIKIYPLSRKPYNAKDLQKLYCPNCGRKLNSKYKYCPYCGQKID